VEAEETVLAIDKCPRDQARRIEARLVALLLGRAEDRLAQVARAVPPVWGAPVVGAAALAAADEEDSVTRKI
jgi:hypothetical protein